MLSVVVCFAFLFAGVLSSDSQPNILFIVADDLRPDLGGFYGQTEVSTPNLNALMKKSVTFERAYAQYSLCSPSRTSVLTGLRPDTTRIWDIGPYFRVQMPNRTGWDVVTLPQYFKDNGYFVTGAGKIYHPGQSSGGQLHSPTGGGDMPYSWSEPYWFCDHFHNGTFNSPRELNYPNGTGCYQAPECRKCLHDAGVMDPKFNAVIAIGDDCDTVCFPDGAVANHTEYLLSRERAKRDKAAQTDGDEAAVPPFFIAVGMKRPHTNWFATQKYYDLYPSSNISLAKHRTPPKNMPSIAWNNNAEIIGYTDVKDHTYTDDNGYVLVNDSLQYTLRGGYYAAVSFMDAQVGQVLDALEENGFDDNTIVVFWGDHGYHLGEGGLWCKMTSFELGYRVPMMIRVPGVSEGSSSDVIVELLDLYPTLVDLAGLPAIDTNEGKSISEVIYSPDATPSWEQIAYSQTKHPRKSGTYMAVSIRTADWRYTEWLFYDWANNGTYPLWDTVSDVELYDHRNSTPNEYDLYETVNVANDAENTAVVAELHSLLVGTWDNQTWSDANDL